MNASLSQPTHPVRVAWAQALPIVFGYLPVGFAFGILAIKAGVSPWNTLAMSLMVFAGSAQLIAVGLIAAGISPWTIIATTFVVNLRHLLMSAALSPSLRGWRRPLLAFFAFQLTDETFAVHSARFSAGPARIAETLAINVIAQAAWVAGTWLGIAAGDLVQDVRPFGLDYALVAMFAALLVFQVKDRRALAVAVFSGLLSTALRLAGLDQWNVLAAAFLGATAGVLIETWTNASSS
jgi:4-azaleucine resistance transporter AzlC